MNCIQEIEKNILRQRAKRKKKKKVAVPRARWRVSRSLLIVITSARWYLNPDRERNSKKEQLKDKKKSDDTETKWGRKKREGCGRRRGGSRPAECVAATTAPAGLPAGESTPAMTRAPGAQGRLGRDRWRRPIFFFFYLRFSSPALIGINEGKWLCRYRKAKLLG